MSPQMGKMTGEIPRRSTRSGSQTHDNLVGPLDRLVSDTRCLDVEYEEAAVSAVGVGSDRGRHWRLRRRAAHCARPGWLGGRRVDIGGGAIELRASLGLTSRSDGTSQASTLAPPQGFLRDRREADQRHCRRRRWSVALGGEREDQWGGEGDAFGIEKEGGISHDNKRTSQRRTSRGTPQGALRAPQIETKE